MQVNSLIVYIGNPAEEDIIAAKLNGWFIPDKDRPYTVRLILKDCYGTFILLDEIKNHYPASVLGEIGYRIELWKEVQPPQNVADAINNIFVAGTTAPI